jgi:transcriptional regulator with XRE-family HTH domain
VVWVSIEVSFNQPLRRHQFGEESIMVLVRQEIGDVLRDFRQRKGRTLRQVASRASVALGYLSEVERGQKEASSEILASVAEALDVPISVVMREVADRLALSEGITIPDTVPAELMVHYGQGAVTAQVTQASLRSHLTPSTN